MAEKNEKLVEVRVPRGQSNEEPCVMIGINGKNWLLPKGKTSKVPAYVAGTTRQAPSVATFDYSKASKAEREALKARIREAAARGEKIYPGR